jgi:hypothetical protein
MCIRDVPTLFVVTCYGTDISRGKNNQKNTLFMLNDRDQANSVTDDITCSESFLLYMSFPSVTSERITQPSSLLNEMTTFQLLEPKTTQPLYCLYSPSKTPQRDIAAVKSLYQSLPHQHKLYLFHPICNINNTLHSDFIKNIFAVKLLLVEHFQHPLSHQEPSENIASSTECSEDCTKLSKVGRSTELQKCAENDYSTDCVGDTHERSV